MVIENCMIIGGICYKKEVIIMYKGKRDSYLRVRVLQKCCFAVTLTSGEWVEVIIPGRTNKINSIWESFMVKPEQVFYDLENPDTFNIIDNINANTKIRICAKTGTINNRKIISGSDYILDPMQIITIFDSYNNQCYSK